MSRYICKENICDFVNLGLNWVRIVGEERESEVQGIHLAPLRLEQFISA